MKKLAHLKMKFGSGENSEMRKDLDERNKKSWKFVKRTVWTRRQRKFRNRGVKLYFNYSKIPISPAMGRLLNRGLNFCITPSKVNVTELLVDIDRFIRKMLWQEFFHDKPDEDRKQAGAELGQAQFHLELEFTLIKVCCIVLMIKSYHYKSLSTISL